jgi:hypothetical protein
VTETMNGKVPADDRSEVSREMIGDFILELKIQAAEEINDSSLLFPVFCTLDMLFVGTLRPLATIGWSQMPYPATQTGVGRS